MATSTRQPSPSGSAKTASSKSRASSPSMVTSGVSAQVGAAARGGGARLAGLLHRLGREDVRDAMGVDADQRDRARFAHHAEHLDDAGRAWGRNAGWRQRLGEDDLAGRAPFASPGGTSQTPFWRRSVGMMRPSSNTPRMRAGAAPPMRLKVRPSYAAGADRLQPRQHAFPGGQRRLPRRSDACG